jgi:hypothetical protein
MSACGLIDASEARRRREGRAIETCGLPLDSLLFLWITGRRSSSILLPGSFGGILTLPLRLERHQVNSVYPGGTFF